MYPSMCNRQKKGPTDIRGRKPERKTDGQTGPYTDINNHKYIVLLFINYLPLPSQLLLLLDIV